MAVKNIIINIFNRKRCAVIIRKILSKLFRIGNNTPSNEILQWLNKNANELDSFADSIDRELWNESLETIKTIKIKSKKILNEIQFKMGGGGAYPLLYFLTRIIRPKHVLETGVAAGFSSQAILLAMGKNNHGQLYSSDFPYFRESNPEDYIGILVDEILKTRWHLFIDGDRKNLKKIFKLVSNFEIVHYDSDKSYNGRKFFMKKIQKHLTKNFIIIMDDIQDNAFFYDFIKSNQKLNWKIFHFEGKYLGLLYHNNKIIPS